MDLFRWRGRRAQSASSAASAAQALYIGVTERGRGAYAIMLDGRLDTMTAPQLEHKIAALLTPAVTTIIFDMTRLVYISSAGVRVIFKVRRSLEERKGTFLMSNVQPQIEKVFAIVNALPRESIFKDMNEVDAYLDVMQKKELEKQQST